MNIIATQDYNRGYREGVQDAAKAVQSAIDHKVDDLMRVCQSAAQHQDYDAVKMYAAMITTLKHIRVGVDIYDDNT